MAIYKKSRGKWRVAIHHPRLPSGRRDWIVSGRKKDAEAFEARERAKLEAGDPVETRTAPTFSAFCASSYKMHAATTLKPRTWQNRQYQLATLSKRLGAMQLTDLHTDVVEQFKQSRKRQGIANSTINSDVSALRAVLSYAHHLGVPCASPRFAKLREPKRRRNAHAWTAADVEKLYKAAIAEHPGLLPLLVCIANTGMRKGEVIALRWENIDLRRRLLRIWPSDDWQPKNDEPREVPISDALRPWLSGRRNGEWVFPSSRGSRYAFWPQRAFDESREAAGLVGGPHTLRHTFASHFLAESPDLYLLAQIMGHSHQRVTELYAHLLASHLERARNVVNLPAGVGPAELEARQRWARSGQELARNNRQKGRLSASTAE